MWAQQACAISVDPSQCARVTCRARGRDHGATRLVATNAQQNGGSRSCIHLRCGRVLKTSGRSSAQERTVQESGPDRVRRPVVAVARQFRKPGGLWNSVLNGPITGISQQRAQAVPHWPFLMRPNKPSALRQCALRQRSFLSAKSSTLKDTVS